MVGRLLVALLVSGCATAPHPSSAESAGPETAYRLATRISAAASALDVDALLPLIPQTEDVVYVSDGHPITGAEYRSVMADFYSSLSRLEWHWDKWEAVPISDEAVAFTGWATLRVQTRSGEQRQERAIYTMVFARQRDGWKRILGTKTTLPDP